MNTLLRTRRVAVWFLVALALVGPVGCAIAPSSPQEMEAALRARAQARWELLLKRDLDGAYQYFSPASRAALSIETYKRSVNPRIWRAAQVEKVECAALESCTVVITIDYATRGGVIRTSLREAWAFSGGNWYLVHQN